MPGMNGTRSEQKRCQIFCTYAMRWPQHSHPPRRFAICRSSRMDKHVISSTCPLARHSPEADSDHEDDTAPQDHADDRPWYMPRITAQDLPPPDHPEDTHAPAPKLGGQLAQVGTKQQSSGWRTARRRCMPHSIQRRHRPRRHRGGHQSGRHTSLLPWRQPE
jgi:hypothetical protein